MDKHFVAENIAIGPSMYQVTHKDFCGRKYRNWSQYVLGNKHFVAKNIAIGYSNMDKHFVAKNIAIGASMYQVTKIFVAENIAIGPSMYQVTCKDFCGKKYRNQVQ